MKRLIHEGEHRKGQHVYGRVMRCLTYIRKQVFGGDGDTHVKTSGDLVRMAWQTGAEGLAKGGHKGGRE